ncbi:hypothetical protein LJY25_07200 [Hymenobacter sp. BT175]|uniref:hypothetical protein n=1 Tax=Hymenobacter translucens TaxID=2886507 RepID=UPI001D0EEDD0|nr:hypothetical protein [Hymenobacter translucens]MCC2546226.1 hypothetical protein [Hymenobacter translucens]
MIKRSSLFLLVLVLGALAAGYAYYRQHATRAETLTSFAELDARLSHLNQRTAAEASATVGRIRTNVCYNMNQARDVAVLATSEQIQARTQAVRDTIGSIRKRLLASTDNQAGAPLRHLDKSGAVTEYLQPEAGTGPVGRLSQQLTDYWKFIKKFAPGIPNLTAPIPETPGSRNPDPDKWFGQYYFNDAPVAVALANLSHLEAQVSRFERDALAHQAEKVGFSVIRFTKIGAMAMPESNTVPPGAVYRAKLFMTTSASTCELPRLISANGKAVPVDPFRFGLVELPVSTQRPGDPDTLRARWQGALVIENNGRDTTLRLTVPYLIVKKSAL